MYNLLYIDPTSATVFATSVILFILIAVFVSLATVAIVAGIILLIVLLIKKSKKKKSQQ